MARRKGTVLPFRIKFFRIFYSTTYTIIFILTLCFLAATPASMIFTAIKTSAYQYIFMIGGTYILTAILALFIYSSRLYTNRSVLAGVGKAYIPIEDGEIGKKVRKMIVKQMERSAIVAWECRPRDLDEEKIQAERQGSITTGAMVSGSKEPLVGTIITVDPENPPWGHVEHPGWSSPAYNAGKPATHVQFASVIAELPNLVEARAVSFAPPDRFVDRTEEEFIADPDVVELLRRPQTMGMRDYLTQLSYLGLFNNPSLSDSFLRQYENARFSGRPINESEFERLMATFSDLISGMKELAPEIIEQIRLQAVDDESSVDTASIASSSQAGSMIHYQSPRRPSADSGGISPVTARTRLSRAATPYLANDASSVASFSSVIQRTPREAAEYQEPISSSTATSTGSSSAASLRSDAGSVLRHELPLEQG